MSNLTNGEMIMRTDRKKDLDRYYNDYLKMNIIIRLQLVKTWSEIKGIESAVFEALQREEDLEKVERALFETWKKKQEEKKNAK